MQFEVRKLAVVGIAAALSILLSNDVPRHIMSTALSPADRARLLETYGKGPLSFAVNQGQSDGSVKFIARGPVYGVYLTPTRAGDRGNCTSQVSDIRHLVNGTGIASMPKFANTWLNAVGSNWRLSGILNVASGSAFTIVSGADRALNGKNALTQYADQISSNTYGNQCTSDLTKSSGATCTWLNPSAFAAPAVGAFGNLGPGTVVGPGSWTVNAGLSRIFKIKESQTVEFRAEGTNILNRANFLSPSGTLTSPQFGRIQSARDGRIMQFGLKYLF